MKINHSTRNAHKGLGRRIYGKFVWHFNGPIISSFRRLISNVCLLQRMLFTFLMSPWLCSCCCCCCLYCYLPLFIWLLTRCSFAFNCARVTRCAYVMWQRNALCYEAWSRVVHFQLRLFENLAAFLLHLAGIRNQSKCCKCRLGEFPQSTTVKTLKKKERKQKTHRVGEREREEGCSPHWQIRPAMA